MTTDEAREQALARAAEFSSSFPTTKSLIWRRLGVRQQELYQRAAAINSEWAGVEVQVTLDSGGADLELLVGSNIPEIAMLDHVQILDAGGSSYSAGDTVHVVRQTHAAMEEAPRCTVRDRVLQGVGTDLDSVTSLTIFYSHLPLEVDATTEDGTTVLELREPFVELLVIDAAKYLLQKALDIDPEKKGRILAVLNAEEDSMLQAFDRHVAGYVRELAGEF